MEHEVLDSAEIEGVLIYSLKGLAKELGFKNPNILQQSVREWSDGYLEDGVDFMVVDGPVLKAIKEAGLASPHAPVATVFTERGRELVIARTNTPEALVKKKANVIEGRRVAAQLGETKQAVLQLEDRTRTAEHKAANADNAVRNARDMAELEVDLMREEMNYFLKSDPRHKQKPVNLDKHNRTR